LPLHRRAGRQGARPILLAGAATTVGVDDRPDIFAERIVGAAVGIDT
jgi:hypothetical protein